MTGRIMLLDQCFVAETHMLHSVMDIENCTIGAMHEAATPTIESERVDH